MSYCEKYNEYKFEKDTTFLVTGGAGFIGSNLCEAILKLGYNVRCLDNLVTGNIKNIMLYIDNPRYQFIQGDIKDINDCIKACEGVDYVLHQAAWGSVPKSFQNLINFHKNNVDGTVNMMEAALKCGVKRFVYASSSSVYGDSQSLPKKEGCEGNILSPYALTKKICEKYGKIYNELYGLQTYGLRYFNVFGEKQSTTGKYAAVIPQFIKALINNEQAIIYGDGMQSRDFTYVGNVVEANLKACVASPEFAGQVFNIGSGKREYLIDVYRKVNNLLNKDIEPVYKDSRVGDIKNSVADIRNAEYALGYVLKYTFEEGLRYTVEWYKENGVS